jgi:purine-binding chemotaxis protein CheW
MDLAKIRQKARQDLESGSLAEPVQQLSTDNSSGFTAVQQDTGIPLASACESTPRSNTASVKFHPPQPETLSAHSAPARLHFRDPLEVLLTGREISGCDDESSQIITEETSTQSEVFLEYLCFRVSAEIYGINIMDIKEIIKPREVTEVPRAPSFVSGVISLRGVIIPIIDMLERLGLPRETVTGRERVIVVKHGESFSGLLVDEIIQVVHISKDCLEAAPAVLEGIDRDFVSGIGRADGRMIILLNLENVADIHLY